MINRRKRVGYELFLPAIAAVVREKEKKDDQLTDAEFKALVSMVFRDTLVNFLKDTHLYREEIPIDIYAGVNTYDIIPPEGFLVDAAIRLKAGEAHLPVNYTLDEKELFIYCCPRENLDRAFYAEVALIPKMTEMQCQFDEDFINRYYDAILAGMLARLFGMVQRTWFSSHMAVLKETEYRHARNRAKRGGTDSSKAVKLKYRRMSDAMCG